MATPVEVAAARAFLNVTVGKLASELEGRYKLWKSVEVESESLTRDLLMLAAAMDDELRNCRDAPRTRAVARAFGDEMRELTHEIEDCIERFLHRVTCKEGASWPTRAAHAAWTLRTRLKFAAKMKKLRTRLQETRSRVLNPPAGGGGGGQSSSTATATASRSESTQPDDPVGIAKATEELRTLLVERTQLSVVAIVGFGGSGKTTLAKEVYKSVDVKAFPCRAWVVAGLRHRDANGILTDIHEQLLPGIPYLATSLAAHLEANENRYFIVIDDLRVEHMMYWDTIRNTFKGNGAIIVTTAIQSIANRCINNRCSFGYVYNMRSLGKEDSRKMALPFPGDLPDDLVQGSAALLEKCDGLPLALASVANHLRSQRDPTGQFCAKLCRDLGSYLEREDYEEPNFAMLRYVLMDNYISLSDYTVKTCLLYLGIFPADRHLRRSVIIRRWLAEGYARSDPLGRDLETATRNFETFIDRSIIQPVDPSNNAVAKTCKTHGIMHVFMLHKSMVKNFIMPFSARLKKVRHLFVHDSNGTKSRTTVNTDLSRVRSLTVLGNASDAISDFRKYKLMRVLDLEGCTDVKDGHLKDICKLWNLRYLSLGPKITELPKEIAQLKLLETLDASKTNVNVLPVEVIGLPCLIHLIGRFKLQDQVMTEQLQECKLETLAGFVADGSQGFLQLMVHMKKLNRVKIWCDSDDTEMNNNLHDAIKKYVEVPIDVGDDRSLSIDFRGLPEGSLYALREVYNHSLLPENRSYSRSYYLSSLKLHGNSSALPEFIGLFRDLKELCLSTTVTQELLSALSEMHILLYLKLVANGIDGFVVQPGKFRSLRRLRLVLGVTSPTLLTIEDGALTQLVSLQLICQDLVGLSGIQVRLLKELKEIALHPNVAEKTRETWEAEATNHPNRPSVLTITRVDGSTNEESTNNPAVARQEPAPNQHGIQQQRIREEGPEPSAVQIARGNTPEGMTRPLDTEFLQILQFRRKKQHLRKDGKALPCPTENNTACSCLPLLKNVDR